MITHPSPECCDNCELENSNLRKCLAWAGIGSAAGRGNGSRSLMARRIASREGRAYDAHPHLH